MDKPLVTSTLQDVLALAEAQYFRRGEDDGALGFECANPALQIERWGAEEPQTEAEPS